MITVGVNLGIQRSKVGIEMERILTLEKELANVGESFIFFSISIEFIERES